MGSDAPFVVFVSVGGPLLAVGISHVLTLARDRQHDRLAKMRREQEKLDERFARLEESVEHIREELAGTDSLLKAYVRGHQEL